MRSTGLGVFLSLSVAAFASCAGPEKLAITSEPCYRLDYDNSTDASAMFAQFVLLEPGRDSGEVWSGRAPEDTSRFWRMFLGGGQWRRDGERLILDFSNGFSGVVYSLASGNADALTGEMRFLYDVVDQRPPPASVRAVPIRCEDANIQSPAKVAA